MSCAKDSAAMLEWLPRPPSFLDPLFNIEHCYYYAVPSFFKADHSSTSWLVKRILAGDTEALRRKLDYSPGAFRDRYFQVLDNPTIYMNSSNAGDPMFHSKCVLYLTPLGLALYFKSPDSVNLLLNFHTPTGDPVANVNEPQFASHLLDTTDGDFHAFVPYIVMLKRELFGVAVPLQQSGWRPNQPLALPVRRRYQRQVVYYRDWLDAGLCHMATRPTFPLAALILGITATHLYSYSRLPMEAVKPAEAAPTAVKKQKSTEKTSKRTATTDAALYRYYGTIPADDRPHSVPLLGVKSLFELCQAYDRHHQELERIHSIRDLFCEARAVGLNTEILLMQAEECIAEDEPRNKKSKNTNHYGSNGSSSNNDSPDEAGRRNSNNHAKQAKKGKEPENMEHCSEPLRVVLFALTKDKSGARLQQCLDSVGVYVKRGYFGSNQTLELDHPRSRDARNVVVCLMNLMAREYLAVDTIMMRIRRGDRCRRSLENARQLRTSTIAKISGLMTSVMLSSRLVLCFLCSKTVPPFPAGTVDFRVNGRALSAMETIRYGVVRDVSGCKDSWKYLPTDMLAQMAMNSSILFHFKVGSRPANAGAAGNRGKQGRKASRKS